MLANCPVGHVMVQFRPHRSLFSRRNEFYETLPALHRFKTSCDSLGSSSFSIDYRHYLHYVFGDLCFLSGFCIKDFTTGSINKTRNTVPSRTTWSHSWIMFGVCVILAIVCIHLSWTMRAMKTKLSNKHTVPSM